MLKKLAAVSIICLSSTMAVAGQDVKCPDVNVVKQYSDDLNMVEKQENGYFVRSTDAVVPGSGKSWIVGVTSIVGVMTKIEALYKARQAVEHIVETTYPEPAVMGDYYICQYSGSNNGTVVLMGHK
jgi:hypothetical protein